jgi:hypothetical protein
VAFFALFLLPFGVAGVATMVAGIARIVQGNWREGLPFLLFGAVFTGFAAGGLVLIVWGRRKLREMERLRTMHPDQPWLWRRAWAAGRIHDSTRRTLWVSWIFAAFWNAISLPVGFLGVQAALREANPKAFLALLFPMVGAGLLVWAVRLTLRYLKYGTSRLELSTVPGSIGGRIAGIVRVPARLQPEDGFAATLSCVRRITTRSGKNSSTSERILWQEESRARGEPVRDAAGSGMRVPLSFRIPADAMASDSTNPRDEIVWRLTLSANVPGVDYHSSFDVPVFRTREVFAEADDAKLEEPPAEADFRQPPTSRITVTRNQRGTEIYFAAARNPGVAASSTLLAIVWTGFLAVLVAADAPWLFLVVFGLFELLLVVGVLQFWFGVSRVAADRVQVTVAQGYLFPGRERTIPTGQIANVITKIGMQAGSTPYYDVVLVRKGGKPVIAGRYVREKREAEWVVQTLKAALAGGQMLGPEGSSGAGSLASSRP